MTAIGEGALGILGLDVVDDAKRDVDRRDEGEDDMDVLGQQPIRNIKRCCGDMSYYLFV